MKTTSTISVISIAFALGACAPPVDMAAEEASLRAAAEAYHTAASAVDMETIVALYTDDAVVMPPNAATEEGMAGVQRFTTAFSQAPGFSVSFGELQVVVAAGGDMGYTLADAAITLNDANGNPVTTSDRDFHLWRKQDGEWKVAVDIWNTDEPPPGAGSASPVEGAWIVTSRTDSDGNTTDDPQPALYVFTGNHYSIMIASGDEPRPGYEGEEMSDSEKLGAYDTLIANAGRYEIVGKVLKTRAYVAKDPNYMGDWPENEQEYEFEIDGDQLTLKNLGFAAGVVSTFTQVEGSPNPWENEE